MTYLPNLIITERGIEVHSFLKNSRENQIPFEEIFTLAAHVDNLRIIAKFSCAKANLIEWLLKSRKFHQRKKIEDCNFAFTVKEDYISLFVPGRTITLCSYETKFMQDFKDFETARELELWDDMRRPTCAQDGKSFFLSTIKQNIPHALNIFKLQYPEPPAPEYSMLLDAKEICKSFFYAKPGEYFNTHLFDIKKSYAARLYKAWTPRGGGVPINSLAEVPERWWFVCRLRIRKIQANVFDFLKLVPDDSKPFTAVFTKETYELLNLYYNYEAEFLSGFAYKMKRNVFDAFVENRLNRGDGSREVSRYMKCQVNLLVGTFAKKDRPGKKYYTKRGEVLNSHVSEDFTAPYLPLYLYTAGSALKALLQFISPIFNSVLYANTDGFILNVEKLFAQPYAPDEPGFLEYKRFYSRLCVKGISNYAGEYIDADGVVACDIVQSGTIRGEIGYEEYKTDNYPHIRLIRQANGFTKFIKETQ